MKWLEGIKKQFGLKALKRSLGEERRSKVKNFDDSRSVGILYQEKGESFYILVKQYVKYLQEEHGIREILAMSYIDDKKEVPFYHVHRLKYDYFTKANLNWKSEPECENVHNFVARDFDILIDLEKDPVLPLKFVLARSKAKFKVGYYSEANEAFYDMMIKTGDNDTFDDYIKQVNHYLKRINKG